MINIIKSLNNGDADLDVLIDRWMCRNFNSTKRPEIFLEIASYLNDDQFWPCLHSLWTGFDKINHTAYSELFIKRKRGWKSSYLSKEDQKLYNSLDDMITVYRGQNDGLFTGLSWTTDRNVAVEFARGHRNIYNSRPIVIEGLVDKKDIAGVYTERKESEIIFFHEFDIDIINSDPLSEPELAKLNKKSI